MTNPEKNPADMSRQIISDGLAAIDVPRRSGVVKFGDIVSVETGHDVSIVDISNVGPYMVNHAVNRQNGPLVIQPNIGRRLS